MTECFPWQYSQPIALHRPAGGTVSWGWCEDLRVCLLIDHCYQSVSGIAPPPPHSYVWDSLITFIYSLISMHNLFIYDKMYWLLPILQSLQSLVGVLPWGLSPLQYSTHFRVRAVCYVLIPMHGLLLKYWLVPNIKLFPLSGLLLECWTSQGQLWEQLLLQELLRAAQRCSQHKSCMFSVKWCSRAVD